MFEEGQSLAKINGLLFLETSAKTAKNVNDVFLTSAEKILENMIENGMDNFTPKKNVKISLDDDNDDEDKKLKRKRGCCN